MTVALAGTVIRVSGPARIEDAESLVALLRAGPERPVDLTRAGPLHAAVLQALLAWRPPILGPAGDPFVQAWLVPLLDGASPIPAVVADASGVPETQSQT